MEFKVRKESQTLLEKTFNSHERRGVVRAYQIPMLLRTMNPEVVYSDDEVKDMVSQYDPEGSGVNFDNFTKITMHFLLKQRRRESNDFSHKNVIGKGDFPDYSS